MGFMDEVSGGGGAKLLKFDGRVGSYLVRGSDTSLNNQEFIADVFSATWWLPEVRREGAATGAAPGKRLSQGRRRRYDPHSAISTGRSGRRRSSAVTSRKILGRK